MQGDLYMEFERDWSDRLGAPLGDGTATQKNYIFFSVSGIFLEKAYSVMLLVFECTINLQTSIKIFGGIFDKIEITFFFLT